MERRTLNSTGSDQRVKVLREKVSNQGVTKVGTWNEPDLLTFVKGTESTEKLILTEVRIKPIVLRPREGIVMVES